eukprot:5047104-Pleurochrysis_carterae.AAC.1
MHATKSEHGSGSGLDKKSNIERRAVSEQSGRAALQRQGAALSALACVEDGDAQRRRLAASALRRREERRRNG